MLATSSCPRCRQPVSLPADASPLSRVRCPLCRDEYSLQEALNCRPPLLEVLNGSPAEPAAAAEGQAMTGPELASPPSTEPDLNTWSPAGGGTPEAMPASPLGEPPLETLNLELTTPALAENFNEKLTSQPTTAWQAAEGTSAAPVNDSLPNASPGNAPQSESAPPVKPDSSVFSFASPPAGEQAPGVGGIHRQEAAMPGAAMPVAAMPDIAAASDEPAVSIAPPDEPAPGMPAWPMFATDGPTVSPAAAEVAIETRPARKRPQANIALELIKMVLGGVAGLMIAYIILLWCGRDPFGFGPSLPKFLVPERFEAQPDDTGMPP